MTHPYSSTDMATAWKKSYFIFSERSDYHMINNFSIAVNAFPMPMLILPSVEEIFLPRNFRVLPFEVKMSLLFKTYELYTLKIRQGQDLIQF